MGGLRTRSGSRRADGAGVKWGSFQTPRAPGLCIHPASRASREPGQRNFLSGDVGADCGPGRSLDPRLGRASGSRVMGVDLRFPPGRGGRPAAWDGETLQVPGNVNSRL